MARFMKSFLVLMILAFVAAGVLGKRIELHDIQYLDYTTFVESARDRRITGLVRINRHIAFYRVKTPSAVEPVSARTLLPDPPDAFMHQELVNAKVPVAYETTFFEGFVGNVVVSLLPFVLLIVFWSWMLRASRISRQLERSEPPSMKRLRDVEQAVALLTKQWIKDKTTMGPDEVRDTFESCGALLNGHFLLTSGLHSPQYLEKFQVLQYPLLTMQLCREIARRFENDNIQLVVGPATGGIILAHEVARQLGVRAIFTEREGGAMTLRRGFQIQEGERVLVVEDVVTTGGSIQEVIDIVNNLGGELVGVALLCDRSNGPLDLGVRTETLMTLNVATYKPDECPQCREGMPLAERGSRNL